MALGRNSAVVKQMQRLFDRGTVSGLSERQLLERFIDQNDDAAFEALVSRHGPMVLGVCRRLLTDPNDVDDAFQATFLVLVRKAKGIHRADLLGNWLYGVAYRVAMRVRTNGVRRRLRESPGAEEIALEPPHGDGDRAELRAVLDEELSRLPATFRAPLVLCYLQGQTHEEAARRLNCPVGTVRSRMARGRERLRVRLIRRGLAPSVALLGSPLTAEAAPAVVAQGLIDRTITAAIGFAAGRATAAGLVSATVITLTNGASTAMTMSKLKGIAAIVLILGASAGGAGVVARWLYADLAKTRARVKMLEAWETQRAEEVRSLTQQLKTVQVGQAAPGAAAPPVGGRAGFDDGSVASGSIIVMKSPEEDRVSVLNLKSGQLKTWQVGQAAPEAAAPPVGGRPGSGVDSLASDSIIITISPKGDRVSILNINSESGEPPASYQAEEGTRLIPIRSNGLLAMMVRGPKITRIAVFESKTWKWYPLDLREPISDEASPIGANTMTVYPAGRYFYAFSAPARRWDVLELEQGAKAVPIVRNQTASFDHDGRHYIFQARTGRWIGIDTRTGKFLPTDDKPAANDDHPRDDAP